MQLIQVTNSDQVQTARQLFEEYADALGISLCFQNFEQELAELPGRYSPPTGRLLLAYSDQNVAGCIALRGLDSNVCEMKRLFVRPSFRSYGLGRVLVNEIINEARRIGYERMRLDTFPGKMDTAIALYRDLGFQEIKPYYDNPVEGATFMELML
jgi:putative acetyltransferase